MAGYVSNNAVPLLDVPVLIGDVYQALLTLKTKAEETTVPPVKPEPAVHPRKSVTDDYIICLEDGRKFKSLKRHLMNKFGLSPEQYREKWDLDPAYPMVAPNYAAVRSELAFKMGLGRKSK